MSFSAPTVVPELDVADLARSLSFYVDVLGFSVRFERPEEERWYRKRDEEVGNRQFVVVDPDGYLLRFFTSLGRRPKRGEL